jgi:hypothetical protein
VLKLKLQVLIFFLVLESWGQCSVLIFKKMFSPKKFLGKTPIWLKLKQIMHILNYNTGSGKSGQNRTKY